MNLEGKIVWPHLFEKVEQYDKTKEWRYECTLLIKKDDPQMEKIAAEVDQLVAEHLEGKEPDDNNLCVKDCDAKENSGADFAGHYMIKMWSYSQPGVVNSDMEKVIDANAIEGGDEVVVDCRFYAYTKGSNGINCGLNNVLLRKKGDKIIGSARKRPADAFAEYKSAEPASGSSGRF